MKLHAITLSAFLGTIVSAQGVVIDSFDSSQSLTSTTNLAEFSFATGTGIIGGTRRMSVIRSPAGVGAGNVTASSNANGNGLFELTSTSNAVGQSTISYWGGTDPFDLLGGIDLTEGGTHDRFRIGLSFTSVPVEDMVIAVDSSSDPSFLSAIFVDLPDNVTASTTVDVHFSDFFELGTIGPADFSSAERIAMSIDAGFGNTDVRFDYVITAPEPSSLALLGMGMAVLMRRRNC